MLILPSIGRISVRLAEQDKTQIGGDYVKLRPTLWDARHYTEIGLVSRRIKKRGQLYHDAELKWELDDFASVQPRKPSKRITIPSINMS